MIFLIFQGVLAAVPLAYILPALCYIKLEPSPILSKAKAPAFLLVIFGLVVAVLGVNVIIFKNSDFNCSRSSTVFSFLGRVHGDGLQNYWKLQSWCSDGLLLTEFDGDTLNEFHMLALGNCIGPWLSRQSISHIPSG